MHKEEPPLQTSKHLSPLKKLAVLTILLSLLVVFISFFFHLSQVTGQNMEPTLQNRQTIIFRKLIFLPGNLRRGDIVLYTRTHKNITNDFVGRVVALPTESIRFENNNFYLDDNTEQYRVEEKYLPPTTKTRANDNNDWIKLGRFEYFIIEDKRTGIIDIEDHTIHKDNIKGVLFLKF